MKRVDPNTVSYRKTFRGRDEVTDDCPKCRASLKNDLSDAGIRDICPHCNCEFYVPGEEKLNEFKQAEAQEKLRKKRAAEEAMRARQQESEEAKRTPEQGMAGNVQAQENRVEIQKGKQKSTHYISLGFMHLVSVITKAIWIFILVFIESVISVIWIFSAAIDAIAGRRINQLGGLLIILIGLSIGVLGIAQLFDIFAARRAFKDGSDPEKTSD